jgi:nicotinate-nucleotide adenylyltransferase
MIDFNNKKVAIFGGSFNPIHIGHLLTGFSVIENLGYDYIIFIPDNIPPHKDFQNAADGKHRMNMAKLAVKNIRNFVCSDIEIKRGGISYTIDTVRELKKIYRFKGKAGIIIGDDLLDNLKSWKEIDELNKISDLICLYRNKTSIKKTKYDITWVKNRIFQISSTEIRARIKNNMPIDFMVPYDVMKYIQKKEIYSDRS